MRRLRQLATSIETDNLELLIRGRMVKGVTLVLTAVTMFVFPFLLIDPQVPWYVPVLAVSLMISDSIAFFLAHKGKVVPSCYLLVISHTIISPFSATPEALMYGPSGVVYIIPIIIVGLVSDVKAVINMGVLSIVLLVASSFWYDLPFTIDSLRIAVLVSIATGLLTVLIHTLNSSIAIVRRQTEVELQLTQQRQRVKQAQAVKDLLQFFTHELRSGVKGLLGMGPRLQRYIPAETINRKPDIRAMCQAMDDAVAGLGELLENLLVLTREGALSLEQRQMMPVMELIRQALPEIERQEVRYDICVSVATSIDPAHHICVERRLLVPALQTALRNAVEALVQSPNNTVFEIRIATYADDSYTYIVIENSGARFADRALRRLTEMAETEDLASLLGFTTKEDGHGLGTAAMIQVARLHGGTVQFGNRNGLSGAWVQFAFPIA